MNFDTVAPNYDRLERGFSRGLMARARAAHLQSIDHCDNALLLGEGPGRFLPLVLRAFPAALVTCIDSSAKMLTIAEGRIREADRLRVTFTHADIRTWKCSSPRFDLIATHFFLDCFEESDLRFIISTISDMAAPGANWLISDFNIPSKGFARWRAVVVIATLYRFFRFTTGLSARRLVSPEPWLQRCAFRLSRRTEFDRGLLRSDWWKHPSHSNNAS
ncbi:MAG TPA: class I SAM-dependent methyltransferase [Chthoniobacteraceae bacterium]|nr:class I SAM-dependent methyltransferase [Chthoniobacteraceae bacterium]